MTDLLLHHYATSPYAEKIRAILGWKQLAWKSVRIPSVMPKPDLTALTGGYRKTPVLQIGADIYCDTKLIARVIERLHPQPALVPTGREAHCAMVEEWSEKLFTLCVPVAFAYPAAVAHNFSQMGAVSPELFQKDRAEMFAAGGGKRPSGALSRHELPGFLARLESQLGTSAFLDGAAPTLADFSVFHPIWFIWHNPGAQPFLQPYPNIRAWCERIAAFGHGHGEELSGADAVTLARDSKPLAGGAVNDPTGLKAGDAVAVAATDYGVDAVTGTLVHADLFEVALRREDPRAGEVVVHFPRAGFRVEKA